MFSRMSSYVKVDFIYGKNIGKYVVRPENFSSSIYIEIMRELRTHYMLTQRGILVIHSSTGFVIMGDHLMIEWMQRMGYITIFVGNQRRYYTITPTELGLKYYKIQKDFLEFSI